MSEYKNKVKTAEEAVKIIKSGDRIFLHSAAAAPAKLIQAMTDRAEQLRNVEIVMIHTEGPAPYADEKYIESFNINAFFVGPNIRKHVQSGRANYIPIFLSEVPGLFKKGILPIDVAMVTVSPPNSKGFCSLGVSVDISNAAIDNARYVIAQVNPNMPSVHGNGIIHISKIHAFVEVDDPIYELQIPEPDEQELAIGEYITELVEDGATLQLGIGGVPNAVLRSMKHHKNLGIHTEMLSDGIVDLVESGVINGLNKKLDRGKIVSGFALGTRKIYDFINDNPLVNLRDSDYTNDTNIIRQNPKVTAINSAIEIDIFGQVCADTIGTKQYSGVGGQMDFIRGASLSEGGKPIIALPSITHKGISRVVPLLNRGASVATTRAHVHYIVTEFGVAFLYGKNLKERAKAMINIAHPSKREELEKAAWQILKGAKILGKEK